MPDTTLPVEIILPPRTLKIQSSISLQEFKSPKLYCGEIDNINYQYSSPNIFDRKPLQAITVGAFMAGAMTGGLMGGSVAKAVIAPIKARNFNI